MVASGLGLKTRVHFSHAHFLSCMLFLRIGSDTKPTKLLMVSLTAGHIPYMYLAEVGCWPHTLLADQQSTRPTEPAYRRQIKFSWFFCCCSISSDLHIKVFCLFADLIKNWHAATGKVSVEEFGKLTNLQHRLPEGAKPFLPSLLVMCGSNFLFIVVSTRMRRSNFLSETIGQYVIALTTVCLEKLVATLGLKECWNCNWITLLSAVANPGFNRGTPINFFPKTAWKWRHFGPQGADVFLTFPRSTTSSGGFRGGAPGARPLYGPKFL